MLRKVTNLNVARCILNQRCYAKEKPIEDIPTAYVDDNNEKSDQITKKQVDDFKRNPAEVCKTIVKPQEASKSNEQTKVENEATAKVIVDEAKNVAKDVAKDLSKEASKSLGKKLFFRIVSFFGFK